MRVVHLVESLDPIFVGLLQNLGNNLYMFGYDGSKKYLQSPLDELFPHHHAPIPVSHVGLKPGHSLKVPDH
jgi:hypothetical protein